MLYLDFRVWCLVFLFVLWWCERGGSRPFLLMSLFQIGSCVGTDQTLFVLFSAFDGVLCGTDLFFVCAMEWVCGVFNLMILIMLGYFFVHKLFVIRVCGFCVCLNSGMVEIMLLWLGVDWRGLLECFTRECDTIYGVGGEAKKVRCHERMTGYLGILIFRYWRNMTGYVWWNFRV